MVSIYAPLPPLSHTHLTEAERNYVYEHLCGALFHIPADNGKHDQAHSHGYDDTDKKGFTLTEACTTEQIWNVLIVYGGERQRGEWVRTPGFKKLSRSFQRFEPWESFV